MLKKFTGLVAAGIIIAGIPATAFATEPTEDTTATESVVQTTEPESQATETAVPTTVAPLTTEASDSKQSSDKKNSSSDSTNKTTKPVATQPQTTEANTESSEAETTTVFVNPYENTSFDALDVERSAKEEELKSLEKDLADITTKIGELERLEKDLNGKIDATVKVLEEHTALHDDSYEDMKLRIKYMYENSVSGSDILVSDESGMDTLLNATEYYQKIYLYDREKLDNLTMDVNEIKTLYDSLKAELEKTKNDKASAEEEKTKVTDLITKKQEELRIINQGISANVMRMYGESGSSATAEVLLEIAAKAQEEALASGEANAKQVEVARNAGLGRSTHPATYGWCAAWVSGVYAYTGGITPPHGDAIDYWNKWKASGSTRMDNIPIGACVISTGDPTYGHIGIYLGGGVVASNLGYVKIETIQSFSNVSAVCQGHLGFVGWVWPNARPIQ